jgi:beta-lactamase superfamily II metal-dependent hydrolase
LIAFDRRAFLSKATASLIATQLSPILQGQSDTAEHQALPPWEPDYLYIHHISTGRGSCALLILPDATTLMIDAGSMITHYEPLQDKFMIDPRPNASLRPGQWIAEYARECLAQAGRSEIDYFLLTHFHEDHMGTVWPGRYDISPRSKYGSYQLGGLTDVAESIPIRKVIDRCYPDYAYPSPIPGPQFKNYLSFIKGLPGRGGVTERFVVGSDKQITLKRTPERYPDFDIRNLASNGDVWTGLGEQTQAHFPPLKDLKQEDYPTENKCALAIRLRYGKFSYFSGGDEDHEQEYGRWPWGDIETVVARASGKVQVAVANHHGFKDACGPEWVRALQPKAFVINGWDSAHPTMISLDNMLSQELYAGPRLVFSTATKPETDITIRRMAEMASRNGHVVFRVPPGGDSFEVFVKDSSVPHGGVIAHFGKVQCT